MRRDVAVTRKCLIVRLHSPDYTHQYRLLATVPSERLVLDHASTHLHTTANPYPFCSSHIYIQS